MKIETLKEKFLDGIGQWMEGRIDEMLSSNPALAIPSVYMKRGCHNLIKKHRRKIEEGMDNAALFIADEDGDINGDTLFADAMELFKNMEESTFDMGFAHGTIGKGKIALTLPDNLLTSILLSNKKTLTFDMEDLMELKKLLTE